MRRRQFIALFGGAATWPLPALSQQKARLPTIGFMGASSRSPIDRALTALLQRLNELGWADGHTVAIEYRWANGQNERMIEIAAEYVRINVDIIVTHGTAAVIAAKQVTSIVPIVFAAAGDPVGTGLVASLSHPGGNVTGLSIQQTDTASKRLELLRQVVPSLRRLAIIANVGSAAAVSEMREVQAVARRYPFELPRSAARLRSLFVNLQPAGAGIPKHISAFGGKADIPSADLDVRYWPKADMPVAFSEVHFQG
jgi:putative ABC transport system substrate-binding protein